MIAILTYVKMVFGFLKKNYKWAFVTYAVLMSALAYILFVRNSKLSEENERFSTNQIALTEEVQTYKTESGKNAARVTELTLSCDEFEKVCADQAKTIKDLNLKLKRVESASTTGTSTTVKITTALKDTVIVKDTINNMVVLDTLKRFIWNDQWNKIEGTIYNDSVDCSYEGIDTLTIVATRVPKKFLFFRWGCKYVQIDAVNSNPSTNIIYNKTVKIK
jgi:hypothetical protein